MPGLLLEESENESEPELCICGRYCKPLLKGFHEGLHEFSPESYERHISQLVYIEREHGLSALAEAMEDLNMHLHDIESEPLVMASDGEEIIIDIESDAPEQEEEHIIDVESDTPEQE